MSLSDRLPSALQKKRLSNRIKDHMLYNTDASISDISNILINKYKYKESDIEKIIENQGVSLDSFINIDDIPKKQESTDFTDFIDGTTIIAKGISAEDISCNEISATNIYFSGKIYDKDGVEFTGGTVNAQLTVKDKKADITAPENNQIVVQTSDNTIHRYNGSAWVGIGGTSTASSGTGGTSTTSSGIDIRGGSSVTDISESYISLNDSTAGFTSKTRNEGEIIYDSSQNIFFEASRSKTNVQGGGDLAFRPLGYSFFGRNMEGQPPPISRDSFFFFLTSKTIVIKWTNPEQYQTGLTGPKTYMPLDATSPIVTDPTTGTDSTGGQIWFPIVNRIMIQIKNLDYEDDNTLDEYQTWGTNTSSKSNTVFPYGRVICEKDRIIPPALNGSTSGDYFGPTYNKLGARTEKKHKLKDFANSIILYKDKSIPYTLEGTDATPETLIEKRVYSAKQSSDAENNKYTIPDSENGYEIKIWLENQYDSGPLTQNDFNVVTLRTMDRIMDETGNEITPSSDNSLESYIKKPIKFLTVEPPNKIRVANYKENDGFHVKLKRITGTTIHYLECIIPRDAINPTDSTKKNEDNIKVESTSSEGQQNEVYFKGYFIEYQTIEADTNASKTLNQLATEFDSNGTNWAFVPFETFSSSSISFTDNTTNSTATMATDIQAGLSTVIYTEGTGTNNNNRGFISAAPYSGGFSTKTSEINWTTSKAFRLNQGDNKFYRFRIRGLNNGNKAAGPVSTKYFYFRFNEPEQITWKTPAPKFNAGPLYWDITLNWNTISKSSKDDNDSNSYATTDLAIMEYKLQRRDSASESWQTISYWKNTNNNPITQDYRIWPTPVQTKDSNYTSNSQTTSWSTPNDTNKAAEWVYYEATLGGAKVYTQEARLLAEDKSTEKTYIARNPSFQFKIQARNYLFGKRVDAANSDDPVFTIKQWFIEETLDPTNNKNITDTRWSGHSPESTALATTAHTSGYTPSLHDNNDDKFEIKFYEKDSSDTNSPWRNSNNVTDYDDTNTRRVKYTTNSSASRTPNDNEPYNDVPDKDYIAYQWKITDESSKTTVDSTTGLSIDRYEIIETINMGTTSEAITAAAAAAIPTIIYSPDFRRGPANWHINEYTPFISASPSFKFTVRAFNFFNSTSSNYSTTSTELTPIKPSVPLFDSNVAVTGIDGKVSSKPTFTLTDTGITILVDEPKYTGYNTNSTATQYNDNQYQDQAISISEFALLEGKFNTSTPMSTGEIDLINGTDNTLTIRSGSSIQGNQSQVATFFHPNGYTITITTNAVVASNKLTFATDHGLSAGTPIKYISGGTTLITGLTVGYTYYVIAIAGENKKMKLATNVNDANANTHITLTGGGAVNTFAYGNLKDLTAGKIEYTFHAKNVLKDTFSVGSSCTLTIAKPSPVNFKHCPKFTWIKNTNKVQLEFFRVVTISSTNTEILKDGATSTIAPHSAVTSGCDVTNEIKKLQWNVKCSGAPASGTNIITTSYGDVGTPTGYNTNGDNATTVAYTISDIGITEVGEEWAKDTAHQIRYRVRNQYNAGWFEDPQADEYCEIKLTAPNTISGISSEVTYALTNVDGSNNILQINWDKPSEYGLHYKHEGGTITAQTQPNIKTYTVYFNDGTLWYVYKRTASSQNDATDDLKIISGSTGVEKWSNSERNAGYTESHLIRIAPEKIYTIEKITAINWLYDSESPAQESTTSTTYYNGTVDDPPIDGSKTVTNDNAPIPTVFDLYDLSGILMTGSTARTVKKLGVKADGTALTNVLLNAHNVKGKSSTMGIKITITGASTATTSECKFGGKGIVTGNSSTLTYTWGSTTTNLAEITMGNYEDLYKDATSATDNQTYWFINASIKLKWLATASDITDFYGKNLTFSVVVTYYNAGTATSTLTRQIETGYYDKTISAPSIEAAKITPSYTPYTCLGLPILHSTDTLTVATEFDNKSSTWVASTDINTITLGDTIASVKTVKSQHTLTAATTVSLTATDMGAYTGTSLVKDAQITVKVKNCHSSPAAVSHSDKYIYDPNTLALIETITAQSITNSNLKINTGKNGVNFTGTIPANSVKLTVLKVPANFNPSERGTKSVASDGLVIGNIYTIYDPTPVVGVNWTSVGADNNNFNTTFTATGTSAGSGGTAELIGAKFLVEKINLTENLWDLNTINKRSLLIYDGKFCSEQNFKTTFKNSTGDWSTSTTTITNEYNDYHSNVTKIINALPASTSTTLQNYIDSRNLSTDNLKTDYRWGIFQYQIENIASDTLFPIAYPLYIQFKLGTDNNIEVGDLYNSGNNLSKVEIWSKLRSGSNETRWNKLIHGIFSFRQDATNYSNRVINPFNSASTATTHPSSSWYLPTKNVFSSWTSSNSDKLIKIRIGKSNNSMNMINTAATANGDDSNKIQLFLAIGLHNSYSKYIGIPEANVNME